MKNFIKKYSTLAALAFSGPVAAAEPSSGIVEKLFLQNGAGAVPRTIPDKLKEHISVKDFGAIGNGVALDKTAIQAAVDAVYAAGGGEVFLPRGIYLLNASIDRKPGVFLRGDGAEMTELKANGNFPVITAIGSSSNVRNRGGASDLLIRCGGKSQLSAHGISEAWTNRTIYKDLRMHGCRYGMYASNVWQAAWTNIHVDGAGADQSYIGFYMAEVAPSNQNNAVQGTNLMAQDVEFAGFRLINFNGSKFVNSEAAGTMTYGWYLGDPTTGTEAIRWGHFVNCLADSTTSYGWRLEKGAATSFKQVQFTNTWSGNSSGGSGWRIAGVSQSLFVSPMVVSSNQSAMYFDHSSRNVISGAQLVDYDGAATGNAGIALKDSSFIEISGSHVYTVSASAKGIIESGTSDSNLAMGNFLQGGFAKTGVNTRFMRNNGAGGERGGSAQITAGNTSVTVTHNMGFTPSINDVRITPRDGGAGAINYSVGSMTATSFVINVSPAPSGTITIAWAIDPIGQ